MRLFLTRLTAAVFFAGLLACSPQPLPVDAVIETELGNIEVHLYPDAPTHRENFLKLARAGYFDGTAFHRLLSRTIIQGGDTISRRFFMSDSALMRDTLLQRRLGLGGPGYTLPAEISSRRFHKRGALSAARTSDQINPERRSSGSQFFIISGQPITAQEIQTTEQQAFQQNIFPLQQSFLSRPENQWIIRVLQDQIGFERLSVENPDSAKRIQKRILQAQEQLIREMQQVTPPHRMSLAKRRTYIKEGGTPYLDGQYSVFGEVVSGMNVVDSLSRMPVGPNAEPLRPIKIKVRVVSAK